MIVDSLKPFTTKPLSWNSRHDIPHRREVDLTLTYKGRPLNTRYGADFICFDTVIVELKALDKLGGVEEAEILNYLKATGCEVGLLLNFGSKSLEYRRFIWASSVKSA